MSSQVTQPSQQQQPQNPTHGEECDICGIIISRRGDMPRHKRTHAAAEDMDAMLHRCPWEGCTYSSLQKTNTDIHHRTHTKERNQVCPDCDSRFSDPGSLIRHRKTLHGYVPKARKTRQSSTTTSPASSTRGRRRRQPYSHSMSSVSSASSSGLSSPDPTTPTSPSTSDVHSQ
ncbi:hypothetical protein E1B28_011619 [Marasmius oreades]|uniref:C2H2-type domain-containing protein n=1 Tax=Marasmius oreades TaxID=181124 RepID=A0A9P7RUP3_9AGAR|nr:uncharacterized protein E1B28_011619 [Marasmius oreades]KAG7089997.1 hypothetical protein E1B28_011619 [Marasmius oreades]